MWKETEVWCLQAQPTQHLGITRGQVHQPYRVAKLPDGDQGPRIGEDKGCVLTQHFGGASRKQDQAEEDITVLPADCRSVTAGRFGKRKHFVTRLSCPKSHYRPHPTTLGFTMLCTVIRFKVNRHNFTHPSVLIYKRNVFPRVSSTINVIKCEMFYTEASSGSKLIKYSGGSFNYAITRIHKGRKYV
jgi:hypothetical protein